MMSKKSVKVKFIGFWSDFDHTSFPLFSNLLIKSKYKLIVSDDPDFVFFGCFGLFADYVKAYPNAVKIFIITEPASPDFVFFDYCFGFERYDFGDRYIFYPSSLYETIINNNNEKVVDRLYFCDFIYRHETNNSLRKHYFDLLSSYKRVESCGTYLNNQENKMTVKYDNGNLSKYNFQKKCKFSLCIQDTNYPWFVNEKITHSINAGSIPIFYGPKEVKYYFNPNRFIFIDDYLNDEELLKRIIEIDEDDSLFNAIVSEPAFIQKDFQLETLNKAYEKLDIIFQEKKIVRETQYVSKMWIKQLSNVSTHSSLRRIITKVFKK